MRFETKFNVGDIVSTVPRLSPHFETKEPRAGFKGRKVTEITVTADDAGEGVYYRIDGAPGYECLPGWPEHELREAFFCPCGMELVAEEYTRGVRDSDGELRCAVCADEIEAERSSARAVANEAATFAERPLLRVSEPDQSHLCRACGKYHSPELPCVTPVDAAWASGDFSNADTAPDADCSEQQCEIL